MGLPILGCGRRDPPRRPTNGAGCLDPQQLLADAPARREAASRAMQVVVLPVPVAIEGCLRPNPVGTTRVLKASPAPGRRR
jgi:hypothetical protein